MEVIKLQKPFLKWVGGKSQIITSIISRLPSRMNNYHELFLGGGSVLLAVLSLHRENKIKIYKKIYAYDINRDLINVYKNIKNNKDILFGIINYYMDEFRKLDGKIIIRNPLSLLDATTSKESYYYWLRKRYNTINKNSVECSALFMILNKLCFRGLYRQGPNGFNVAYGHYKKVPCIISEQNLHKISDLIRNVEFIHLGFEESIRKVKPGDYVYLDPPYVPRPGANGFVRYVKSGFGLERHKQLFRKIKNLKNIKFTMSNSRTNLVLESFKNYNIISIWASRKINSKNPGSKAREVIIYN